MSGTASRFQTRFGYGPELRAGQYPVQPAAAPLAPAAPSYAPPTLAPPAPAPAAPVAPTAPAVAPVAPPVSAGSNTADLFRPQTDGVSAGDGTFPGYGEFETVGQFGTTLGTLAGLAGMAGLGIPGLGSAISAVGTALDVSNRNQQLADLSIPDRVNYPSALLSGMTLNALGRSPQDQFDAIWGQVAPDPASLTPENTAFPDNPFGPAPNTGNLTTPTPDMTPNLNFDFGNVSYTGGGGYGAADPGGYGANADNGMGAGFGYQAGGYTGAGPDQQVQPWQPAGTVHEGEHVSNAAATSYYGPDVLAAINEQAIPRSILAMLAGRG